mgnify:FL=1
MKCVAILILCVCFSSCVSLETKSTAKASFVEDRAGISRDGAFALVWELQRLYVLCGKLEPENKDVLLRQYHDSGLVKFEEFYPIEQNPYVAVINNAEIYDMAYVNGDPDIKRLALSDCKTQYPRLLKKFQLQKATLMKAAHRIQKAY